MTGLEGTPGYSVPLRRTTGFEGVPRRTTVYLFFWLGLILRPTIQNVLWHCENLGMVVLGRELA